MGKNHEINGPFSIAMLVYQRVTSQTNWAIHSIATLYKKSNMAMENPSFMVDVPIKTFM